MKRFRVTIQRPIIKEFVYEVEAESAEEAFEEAMFGDNRAVSIREIDNGDDDEVEAIELQ